MIEENPDSAIVETLIAHVARFPESAGVYLMKDSAGVPLYIGKAINLRSRVRSYFIDNHDTRINIPVMLRKVDHIDWIATNNETEALILEANLIRKHLPKYNVDLRDDKHFPYLKVTVQEPFPRLLVVRRVERDGARYFGPYTDVTAMRRMIAYAKKIFRLRDCKLALPLAHKVRPCINFSMRRCSGPCCEAVSQQEYAAQVSDLVRFLSGKRKDLVAELESRMENAAASLRFEAAASLRDQMRLIRDASKLQQVDLKLDDDDIDVFGLADGERGICLAVLQFREGLLVNSHHYLFPKTVWSHANPNHDNLFVRFYLERGDDPPPVICIPENAGFAPDILQGWLDQLSRRKVELVLPQRGTRKLLLSLAEKNATLYLLQKAIADTSKDCADLQEALSLDIYPRTIEAFDISNLGSSFTVAGMVQFVDGKPNKSAYRRYKIKSVDGQNDFAMMLEVVGRRLQRLTDENKPFPDLLLIDGGPGQLHAAMQALCRFATPPRIVSLAKQEELLHVPHRQKPVRLPQTHPARKLVERIRDEVHRYAITYHRQLRGKQFVASKLESVGGIGSTRAAKLLKKFGSLKRVLLATDAELTSIPGISQEIVIKIRSLAGGSNKQ